MRYVPLSEAADVVMGTAPPGESYNSMGQGMPLIAGAGDYGLINPEPKKWTTAPTRTAVPGDLIVCVRATIGDLNWADKEYCLGRGVAGVRPHPNILDARFVAHYVALKKDDLLRLGTGSTFPAIRRSDLEGFPIPLPPMAEQKRIAAILDAADALRAKRREALAQLDTLLQATFLEMFGDPVTNPKGWEMGVVGDLLQSANYGTSKKADEHVGALPVLRMNNITYTGEWDFTNLKFMDLSEQELTKYFVHAGQILFNRTNSKELVGKTAVYREKEPMVFAGYLVRATVKKDVDSEYIGAFMNTPQIKKYLQNKCKNIVGMANINAKEFQKIPIPKPPSNLQNEFGSIVKSVLKIKDVQRAYLAELDTLFASLQSRFF